MEENESDRQMVEDKEVDQEEGPAAPPNPPPAKKRGSLLLENLLGATFSRSRGRDFQIL